MKTAVPILMYHQVMAEPAPAAFRKYTVTPATFASQMRLLKRLGFASISLDALVQARRGQAHLPPHPVIITFDDGMRSCVETVVPILDRCGFRATFFLVAGLVGQSSRWLAAERGIEYELADWASARQLVARGFTCGSHTMTHPRLASLAEAECRRELVESRSQLQDRLGQRVQHLAYPFGSCNARVAAIAIQTGYETACTVEIGRSRNESLFGLRRIPITGFDSLVNFIWRLETGWRLDEWWRGKLGRTARRTQPVTIGVPK